MAKSQSKPTYRKRTQNFMERAWLVISILSFITWIYAITKDGFQAGKMLLIIFVISVLMYVLRRYLGKQGTANQQDKTQPK